MGVKLGLVGCGRQAPKHISGLAARGDVEIVVADLVPERAGALAGSQPVTAAASVDDIFADPEIAAVSICTPPASHGALIRRAIAARKHFICEKPLTASLAEARALKAETERAGLVGMAAYIYRFAPAFELAAAALGAGALGQIASAYFRLGAPGSHDVWQHRLESDGGAINEMAVHMIDLAIWYFGPIAQGELVAAEVRQAERRINGEAVAADAEDWVLARLRSASGVDIVVQVDLTTPTFVQFAEIHGTNGTFMGSIQHDMPTFLHCLEARAGYAPGKTAYEFGQQNLFEAQMGLFVDCVAGTARLDKCTLADSVALLEATELLRSGPQAAQFRARGNG